MPGAASAGQAEVLLPGARSVSRSLASFPSLPTSLPLPPPFLLSLSLFLSCLVEESKSPEVVHPDQGPAEEHLPPLTSLVWSCISFLVLVLERGLFYLQFLPSRPKSMAARSLDAAPCTMLASVRARHSEQPKE